MAFARRQYRATHRPPNAASMRGLRQAAMLLYSAAPPLPADERADIMRVLELAPYRKRQGDLTLVLRESDSE